MTAASLLSLLLLAAPGPGADASRPAPEPARAPAAEADAPDAGTPAADPLQLVLGVGTQKVLPVQHLKAVAVAAPEVLDVRPLTAGELLLVGLKPGHSDLTVFHFDGTRVVYKVDVARDGPADDATALRELFRDSPRLAVQLVGDRIFLTGLFGSLEDYERSRYFPRVVCLARLDPDIVRARVVQVNEALARAGFKDVQAVLHGSSTLALEGVVQNAQEQEKAYQIARAIFGPVGEAVDELAKSGVP